MLGIALHHDPRKEYREKLSLLDERIKEISVLYEEKEPSSVVYNHFSDMNIGDSFEMGGFKNTVVCKTEDEIEIETICKKGSRTSVHFHDFLEVIADKKDILIVTGDVKKIKLQGDRILYSISPNVAHSIYVKNDGNITSYLKNPDIDK